MNVSPIVIEVALHFYYSPSGVDFPRPSPAVHDATQKLLANGVIGQVVNDTTAFLITDKGKVWIAMLLSTPLPVSVTEWHDPRFKTEGGA